MEENAIIGLVMLAFAVVGFVTTVRAALRSLERARAWLRGAWPRRGRIGSAPGYQPGPRKHAHAFYALFRRDSPGRERQWQQEWSTFAVLAMHYSDARQAETQRTVRVTAFGYSGDAQVFRGECSLRGAPRSFRVDRIQACIDASTGEVVLDAWKHFIEHSPQRSSFYGTT